MCGIRICLSAVRRGNLHLRGAKNTLRIKQFIIWSENDRAFHSCFSIFAFLFVCAVFQTGTHKARPAGQTVLRPSPALCPFRPTKDCDKTEMRAERGTEYKRRVCEICKQLFMLTCVYPRQFFESISLPAWLNLTRVIWRIWHRFFVYDYFLYIRTQRDEKEIAKYNVNCYRNASREKCNRIISISTLFDTR